MESLREHRRIVGGIVATIALVGAAIISLVSPFPEDDLPDVALGFPLLLHVERAAALLAVLGASALVTFRAANGELPTRFAQLEYESHQLIRQANHEERIRRLEKAHSVRTEPRIENGEDGGYGRTDE